MRHQSTLIVLLTLFGLAACSGGEQQGQQGRDTPPPPVTVQAVETTDVDIEEDYAGRVRGAREVHVRARVEGVLEERLYEEGSLVEQGTVCSELIHGPSRWRSRQPGQSGQPPGRN